MAQFMDKNQSAGRLAVQVCTATANKLTRHISQYFTKIIVAEWDEDLNEIRTAHALIQRLWAACPALLPTVIPQLEEELQAEDLVLWLLVTQVWFKRKNDKAPQVRLKFIEATRDLLSSSAVELKGQLGFEIRI
ncbi:hypothetical protein B0H14DRAFT_2602198 [Mycena olivaceomarginata]|nr:hypothetical protein B0H14DRAFT_2602198 [Mycena olivaceomarginata]